MQRVVQALRRPGVRLAILIAVIAVVALVSTLQERQEAALPTVESIVDEDGTVSFELLIGRDVPEAARLLEEAGYDVGTQPLRLIDPGGLRHGMVTDVSVEHNLPLEPGARLIITYVELTD